MLDEQLKRRSDFLAGLPIRLANGQEWLFALQKRDSRLCSGTDSREDPHRESPFDAEYRPLLEAVTDSEDQNDRLKSELALAIYLLARNYRLTPSDFQMLLEYPEGDPNIARLQRRFHELALEHALGLPGGVLNTQGDLTTNGFSAYLKGTAPL